MYFESITFLNIRYLLIIAYTAFINFVGPFFGIEPPGGSTVPQEAAQFWARLWGGYTTLSAVISLLLIAGILYCYLRIRSIRAAEQAFYEDILVKSSPAEARNERWEAIQQKIHSDNPSDWRQAILDADVMLDEMVKAMGYRGENLGERLKAIEKSDFETLDAAWEAHKVRNQIAHEGAGYQLDHRRARTVIDLYRQVFEEFFYI